MSLHVKIEDRLRELEVRYFQYISLLQKQTDEKVVTLKISDPLKYHVYLLVLISICTVTIFIKVDFS